jgi:hypothetical protein
MHDVPLLVWAWWQRQIPVPAEDWTPALHPLASPSYHDCTFSLHFGGAVRTRFQHRLDSRHIFRLIQYVIFLRTSKQMKLNFELIYEENVDYADYSFALLTSLCFTDSRLLDNPCTITWGRHISSLPSTAPPRSGVVVKSFAKKFCTNKNIYESWMFTTLN